MNLPLIPSLAISFLALVFTVILLKRIRSEKNILLFGKIGALITVAIMYALFDIGFFDVFAARILARYAWVIYLLSEIVYHYGKTKWKWMS